MIKCSITLDSVKTTRLHPWFCNILYMYSSVVPLVGFDSVVPSLVSDYHGIPWISMDRSQHHLQEQEDVSAPPQRVGENGESVNICEKIEKLWKSLNHIQLPERSCRLYCLNHPEPFEHIHVSQRNAISWNRNAAYEVYLRVSQWIPVSFFMRMVCTSLGGGSVSSEGAVRTWSWRKDWGTRSL